MRLPFALPLALRAPSRRSSIIAALCALAYLLLVRALRWRRYKAIHKKYMAKFRARTLTPEEAQDVVHLAMLYDMPTLSGYSVAFALFKTYGIPTISQLLLDTRQLGTQATVARRYADTALLIGTWVTCPLAGRALSAGPDDKNDPRASLALARVNWLHAKYKISNDDYLYTLGLFMFEPAIWAKRWGWRELSELEKYASFVYWSEIGRKLNLQHIPSTPEELQTWLKAYEEDHMLPAESNHIVATYSTGELLFPVPKAFGLRDFAEGLIRGMLDDRVRIAMMEPEAPAYARPVINTLMAIFAFTEKNLLLPRWKLSSFVPVDVPKDPGMRQNPTRWTSRPWYKARGRGFGALADRFWVLVGRHDDIPRIEYHSEGYRLHELGPIRYEQEGHDEVFKMAEELQGCPVAHTWKGKNEEKV
ncbi:hypothetical protein FB45DRAFT_224149 [Roridomyces roridus]|uniref:ER-bound oxygenase mpaB/mpaB'/Rubber oxygenase catalytic domain-containing protein n=1 Tax=Roridomyces roridus TaxID=1738132 RepID=A0AAD7FFP1_9AGAR|nr:hypothetical protein FB45DRAFT_224149 [Roridomyces roridus]